MMFPALMRNVSAAPYPVLAKYSLKYPTIDGFLGSAEWNDTQRYLVHLTNGTTDIETWLYVKHNGTHIFVGLLVQEIYTHPQDEFAIAFDEGDDGSYGGGTRDYVLTTNQEDLKVWYSSSAIRDGFYANGTFYAFTTEIDFDAQGAHENDHVTNPDEIEYWENLTTIDDHWEVEFAIPFVGHDGGTADKSDLSCTINDTVGIKLQYFYGPGPNNYYFPAGTLTQIGGYANLYFSPLPTVESCNATGTKKDAYVLGETVCVNGSGYLPSTTFDFYVVDDVATWTNGMPIPTRVPGTLTAITSDPSGNILPTAVWSTPGTIGKYDIVVDVNRNGVYDAQVDTLDNNDVEVTAGFMIPEFSSLALLSILLATVLLAAVLSKRKHTA
jgi:hypothetical protein